MEKLKLRKHAQELIDRLNAHTAIKMNWTHSFSASVVDFVKKNERILNLIYEDMRWKMKDKEPMQFDRSTVSSLIVSVNINLGGLPYISHATPWIADKTAFDNWKDRPAHYRKFNNWAEVWKKEGKYKPIVWILDPKTCELIPSPTEKDPSSWIWASYVILIQDISKQPRRMKVCPFCAYFFWDDTSRNGDRKHCNKAECLKKRNLRKQLRFQYAKRVKQISELDKKIAGLDKLAETSDPQQLIALWKETFPGRDLPLVSSARKGKSKSKPASVRRGKKR